MHPVGLHDGSPNYEIHAHQKTAKYVFVSSDSTGSEYEHDHSSMSIAKLAEHLRQSKGRRGHVGKETPSVNELHFHDRKFKDKSKGNFASILNYNSPLAISMHEFAEVFFLGIEGSFKASSILTEIIETGINASVASVPSVSLWMDAPGLREFITEVVKGRPIVIVPDADWAKNANVNAFSYFCKARLLEYGATQVLIAAPPVGKNKKALWGINAHKAIKGPDGMITGYTVVEERCKGIDDFLGFGKGRLSDLVARDVIPPDSDELKKFIRLGLTTINETSRGVKEKSVSNCAQILSAISIFAGGREMLDEKPEPGMVKRSLLSIGKAVGMDVKKVANAVTMLEEIGAIEVDGDFSQLRGDPALIDSQMVPVIWIDSRFRSTLSEPVRLGDVFPFLY